MHICHTKEDLRAITLEMRKTGAIGLVPTMGNLHDGHMALVAKARAENDFVLVSIFVNPTQFGAIDDLQNYPRSLQTDLAKLGDAGVDGVFTPTPDIMYHDSSQTYVETSDLTNTLLGALRPGHFRGVATVVAKLFNIFQPDRAYFGEKDFQQLAVIRTMVRDLDIPVKICSVPTVREANGLAMSSRNERLSAQAREAASILFKACQAAEHLVADGITSDALSKVVWDTISSEALADIQSVDVRDAETLAELSGPILRPAVILLAVRFDPVLLIDQYVINPHLDKI